MDIVEECDLTFLHVFPYSEREGTPAAKMPQVDKAVRKERAARLRALGDQQMAKFLAANENRDVKAIAENNNAARAENFALIKLDETVEPGALLNIRTGVARNGALTGKVIAA